jgi:hypothetical protein
MPHPTAVFRQHGTESFGSLDAATAALEGAGFTLGEMERNQPTGFALGSVRPCRWSRAANADRSRLHGQLWTSRDGETTVMLHQDAPSFAVSAFQHVLACADRQRVPLRMDRALASATLLLLPVLVLLSATLVVTP